MKGLLDTSIFIAREQERPLASELLPDQAAISVVTLAELELGVHMAATPGVRSRRLATLTAVRQTYLALPVDEGVASAFATLAATLRTGGRAVRVQDAWIAATAIHHDVALFTRDAGFDPVPGLRVERV